MKRRCDRIVILCVFSVLMALTCCGCLDESLTRINVEGGNPPRFFIAHGELLNMLFVFRVPPELANQGIPGKRLKNNDPDMVWWIEGKRRNNEPIVYGVVPEDMREITLSKPLVEGQQYLVQGNSIGPGGAIGKRFIIRGGQAIPVVIANP